MPCAIRIIPDFSLACGAFSDFCYMKGTQKLLGYRPDLPLRKAHNLYYVKFKIEAMNPVALIPL